MKLIESLLPEFDHEMANSRKVLERIQHDKLDWQPHEKSWSLGGLATHLANLPGWTLAALQEDSLDIDPPDGPAWKMPEAHSVGEILALFYKNVAEACAAIAATSDEAFFKPWTLLSGGNPVFTQPRIAVLRVSS